MKNPDTGRCEPRFNPESEWVHVKAPHLRIISDELWQAARARQHSLIHVYEANMAKSRQAGSAATVRPRTLLSGLLVCGVCGGAVAKRGNNRFGCVSHVMGKGCSNSRTIVRDVLETRVLAGLKDRLMEPEAFAEAMRSFIEEANRLNHIRRANHGADVERLGKARKAIAGIVAAIEDGGYSRPLMERLKGLEAEVEAIEAKLAEAPRDVPDVHPNVAELYRRKVERLSLALDQPDERDEAAQALRALIDRIVLEPGPKRGEVLATLYGDLETILAWAADQGGQRREAVMGFPAGALSVAVNTRAGMTES